MLKKFKKSEIAIYAISLMLVAAGYFNYSTFNQKTEETYSEDVGNISEQYANVGDAVLVSNNETENVTDENTKTTTSSSETTETKTENETDYCRKAERGADYLRRAWR